MSIVCYFDLWTFHQKSIRPVGHFVPMSFRNWSFRFYDISNYYGISNFVLFDPMFFSIFGRFIISHFNLCPFRSYVISIFGPFIKSKFDLLDISYQSHSELWTFSVLWHFERLRYFDLRTFSTLCYFGLWCVHDMISIYLYALFAQVRRSMF